MIKDIMMLISIINMRLRDDDMSLENILAVMNIDQEEFELKLSQAGYYFDQQTNQLKQR